MSKKSTYQRFMRTFRKRVVPLLPAPLRHPTGCLFGALGGVALFGALLYFTRPLWYGLFDTEPPVPIETRHFDGIDVSKHQGRIDWKTVAKDQRIQFVYIKATEGASLVDRRYATNIREAADAGLMVGSYHFFLARKTAEEQFANFKRTVDVSKQDLLPMVDVEESGCTGYSREELQANLAEFMELVKAHYGKYPVLYSQYRFYNTMLAPEFNRYYLFIARYPSKKGHSKADASRAPIVKGKGRLNIWQFADDGHVQGIKEAVDLDVFAKGTRLGDIRL